MVLSAACVSMSINCCCFSGSTGKTLIKVRQFSRLLINYLASRSVLEHGYYTGPAGARFRNFDRETGHHEAPGRQQTQICQFFDLAVLFRSSYIMGGPDTGHAPSPLKFAPHVTE